MKKVIFSIILIVSFLFTFSILCYAEENNPEVKNAVAGAENKVEDTARNTADAIKRGTGNLMNAAGNAAEGAKNGLMNAGENMKNGAENLGNKMQEGINTFTNNGDYNASRTAADGGQRTGGYMSAETWSWIIIGAVAIAIITLFWYYAANTKNNRHRD